MRALAIIALFSLFATACSPTRWSWQHVEGLGPEALQQDSRTCEALSQEEADYWDSGYYYYRPYSPYGPPYSVYRSPYWHRHYYPYWYGDGWYPDRFSYYRYRNDLYRVCMRAKGWQRVPLGDEEAEEPNRYKDSSG